MGEVTLQAVAVAKLFIALLFSLCYGLGGMWRKWLRRFVAPLGIYLPGLLWLSSINHSFHVLFLLSPLLFCASFHLGYSNRDGKGWIRRLIVGAALAVSALPIALITHNWLLFGIHSALCVGLMYALGVYNPMQNARDEETFIGFMSIVIPLFMI